MPSKILHRSVQLGIFFPTGTTRKWMRCKPQEYNIPTLLVFEIPYTSY